MFTLKELHGKLVPINVCYTIVDEVSYMQLFLSKDKKVKKEYEIKPYVRHTSKYDYVVIRGSVDVRQAGHDYYILAKLGSIVPICFSKAQEVWDWTKGGKGLGVSLEKLEILMRGKPKTYLWPVSEAQITDRFEWDDSIGNQPGFLPPYSHETIVIGAKKRKGEERVRLSYTPPAMPEALALPLLQAAASDSEAVEDIQPHETTSDLISRLTAETESLGAYHAQLSEQWRAMLADSLRTERDAIFLLMEDVMEQFEIRCQGLERAKGMTVLPTLREWRASNLS